MSLRRCIEFVVLFLGIPVILRVLPLLSQKTGIPMTPPIIPVLIVLTGVVLIVLLRTTPFKPCDLIDCRSATRRDWRFMLVRFLLLAGALALALLWVKPEALLHFPRTRPHLWLLVMCLYPILSVMPQGIIYRAFYRLRYAPCLPAALRTLLAAAVFSFAHLPFANGYALAFTFIGGWMFFTSYRRTRSLLFSSIEHALYGTFIFTIGWGEFFFHAGTLRVLSH